MVLENGIIVRVMAMSSLSSGFQNQQSIADFITQPFKISLIGLFEEFCFSDLRPNIRISLSSIENEGLTLLMLKVFSSIPHFFRQS